jgi:hypothetical protein
MEYYVYIHKKLTDGSVFYVGRGKGKRKTSKQNRNNHWKNIAAKHGFEVEVIEENLTFESSNDREIYWIQKYKDDGVVLANITTGGGGVCGRTRPDEEKLRISIALTGKRFTEEHKAKMIGNTNGAGPRSEDFRKKMSEVMKGKPKSEAHKESLRKALKGKPLSSEHLAKRAIATAKRKMKDLTC